MKSSLAISLFSVLLAVAYAGKCMEQAECDAGTCCAGVPPFGGVCMPMTVEGGKCNVVEKSLPFFGGDYYVGTSCPCDEGLVCVQEGKKKNKGTCQAPPTTAAPTAADDGAASASAEGDSAASASAESDSAASASAESGSAAVDSAVDDGAASAGADSAADAAAPAVST